MRTIKFRVWNNKAKIWIHGPHECPDLDGVNLIGETILLGNFLNNVSIKDLNDIIVCEFTGLKDKNGKCIYEGDIVTVTQKNGFTFTGDVIFDLIMPHGQDSYLGFGIRVKGEKHEQHYTLFSTRSDFCASGQTIGKIEVIGNIFESKD